MTNQITDYNNLLSARSLKLQLLNTGHEYIYVFHLQKHVFINFLSLYLKECVHVLEQYQRINTMDILSTSYLSAQPGGTSNNYFLLYPNTSWSVSLANTSDLLAFKMG